MDYTIIQSTNPDFNKAVVRVNITREHRQTVQVSVSSCSMLSVSQQHPKCISGTHLCRLLQELPHGIRNRSNLISHPVTVY